jgi:ubiquinone/menaquinone biosynthesis C-methylase UbiE
LRKSLPQNQQSKTTSWSDVSGWYNDYLKDEDNYQHKVILPNFLRLLNIKDIDKKIDILDLGCGQGFFIEKIIETLDKKTEGRVNIHGVDLSSKLLKIAEDKFIDSKNISFKNTDAGDLSHLKDGSIDKVYSVLALQNMNDIDKVIKEIKRVLNKDGRCLFVINHPSFRIPKESDWRYDTFVQKQGRVVYNYMSDKKYIIDMNPGKKAMGEKTEETISFHHPLQYFAKIFNKHEFAISRIEEWISHKKSEDSVRGKAEDDARKEIPMFMCLELVSVAK